MFISSILEWLSNSNETLNSSSGNKESHKSFVNSFKKHYKAAKMNFQFKGLVPEWKLVARKNFEKISYVGVSPIPQLVYINLN